MPKVKLVKPLEGRRLSVTFVNSGVSWSDDVDLSEYELWVNGKEPAMTE